MEKKLKVSYKLLNLSYSATQEEVETRKKAMVKILEADRDEKTFDKIEELENACETIIENIKKNGIPKEEHHLFEASNESIIGLSIVLIFVVIICFFSFYLYS